MAEVAKRYQDNLKDIKKKVENSYAYFRDNYDRFNDFRKFVFQTSMSSDDITLLQELQKPQVEFNILESYISRLRGEFSQQEPSISVRCEDGVKNVDPKVVDTVEGYIRAIFFDANNDGMEYDIYTDVLSGGFSVAKVFTDYANEMSFQQNIYVRRVFDPTLCGFDPLASKSHKGDGRYCFELYPKTRDEVEEEYGKEIVYGMKFIRNVEGFSWGYTNDLEDIVMLCDFYEKKRKRVKIVQIVNGDTMTMEDYEARLQRWKDKGIIQQPPAIVGKPRMTDIETICRYRFVENKVIEYVETDYKYFPLIFIDGNSIGLRDGQNGNFHQMTRPYVYHAKGVQKLKNFAGQTLANELENMVMHKFKVAKESIPPEYTDAYVNIQKASVLVYNAYKDNDPNVPLPAPQEIIRVPAPPEVINTFQVTDQVTQAILGSFDMDMGKLPSNALSGLAIQETATLGNSAAKPAIVGFTRGLNRIASIIVDLIPKYYITPRTIPILKSDGKRSYQKINQPDGIKLDYDSNVLDVKVEAGVSFQMQKSRALQQIIALMQASPLFAQFMNTEGLGSLLDNIDIRGIDQLKENAEKFSMQLKQQQAMQQKMQMQQMQQGAMNNPVMAKMQMDQQKLQLDSKKMQMQGQIDMAKIGISQQQVNNDRLKIHADISQAQMDAAVEADKANAEKTRNAIDLSMDHHDMVHRHAMDIVDHGIDLSKHHLEIHNSMNDKNGG